MNEPHLRLKQARQNAGFDDAASAARSLGVAVPTYVSHENGSRGFRAGSAENYARRFKVSVEWLLYGRQQSTKSQVTGFAESDVQPLDMSSYNALVNIDETPSNVASFHTKNGAISLGIRPGAVLLVDLKTKATTGDTVIATKDDRDIGISTTLLRRLVGDYLIADTIQAPEPIDSTITIRGRIIRAINEF